MIHTLVRQTIAGTTLLVAVVAVVAAQTAERRGVLLLAHGGRAEWNERVSAIVRTLDAEQPTEVAFGMATRPNIQAAVDRLAARGVTRIVAVPLFVSSHSSVVTSTEYLLGLRGEMPRDLLIFAKMSHGAAHGGGSGADHTTHATAEDNTKPVKSTVPLAMTAALNAHPLVASILADRAEEISEDQAGEAVILVAHGPVPDADNERWLADMKVMAERLRAETKFKSVDYLTVRDDAPKPIRDAAAEELRAVVSRRSTDGSRVLIVPLLLSYGGIEEGIRKRLDGLQYVMAKQALTPDDRVVEWVRQMVKTVE